MTSVENCSQCPECQSKIILDYGKGEYVCHKCGCVVMEQVDYYGPENNSTDFEERNKNTRASGSTSLSLHDFGLRTEIGNSSRDYSGRIIDYQNVELMNRSRRWHSRLRVNSSKERRLSNVLSKINEVCSVLCLRKTITETASMIYRNFETNSKAKGKSITCIASATIYLACKRCGVVRSIEEIVQAAGISELDKSSVKLASRYYRSMVMEMNKIDESKIRTDTSSLTYESNESEPPILFTDPKSNSMPASNSHTSAAPSMFAIDNYISKLANIAKIDTKIERLALEIAQKTNNNFFSDGKAPNGLAAAYIYLASVLLGVNLLQIDVSNFAGVTEVTIRNRCKDILNNFKLVVNAKPVN
jgi:transcription initiation factor TFIIB